MATKGETTEDAARLRFFFSPELKRLIFPEEDSLEEGTDSYVPLDLHA